MLPAPLGADESLRLVGILFERLHRALHLTLLGCHRRQPPTKRELRLNPLTVQPGSLVATGH
jgi:hypothetical protein